MWKIWFLIEQRKYYQIILICVLYIYNNRLQEIIGYIKQINIHPGVYYHRFNIQFKLKPTNII